MLLRALLQTSLLLWLAQQTLQGGVKPQNVAYGKALAARAGMGIGIKPGVPAMTGALGAMGSRYGAKAMKTGIGRYPAAQLGAGGYRSLGLGGRAGMKPGGFGTHGIYGASLGTGMGLGAGLANGYGLGMGQGKRVYGAGLGTIPGYGPYGGMGYAGVRPGGPAADLGGPEVAGLGQVLQDHERQKSAALGHLYGMNGRIHGPGSSRRNFGLSPSVPEIHTGVNVQSLDPAIQTPGLIPITCPDKQDKALDLDSVSSNTKTIRDEALLAAAGGRRPLPADKDPIGSSGSDIPQKKKPKSCGYRLDLSGASANNRFKQRESETQRLLPEAHVGEVGKHLSGTNPQAQGERGHQLPVARGQGASGNTFLRGQGSRNYLSALAGRQNVKGPKPEDISRLKMRGTEDGGQRYGSVIPGGSGIQSLGTISAGEEQEAHGINGEGQDAKQAAHANRKSKSSNSGQTGRSTNTASFLSGAGNYLGASLGAGGYGAGLGQGAYLGGAAGKLGAAAALGQGAYAQGIPGKSNGYGDGLTGYLGAMGGNGYGYGNGYGDAFGAALGTGAYGGQIQGAYGTLGTGLESTGGKYGGAGAVQTPVIPAGLEGDGGYPYATQQLSLTAEGGKTTNKYGYGAQLGVTQDALGEQTGKYGGVNVALGNGYKG